LQNGQGKTRRLAGPGLGRGQQVNACEHRRDSLRLNWSRLGVARIRNGTQQFWGEPKGRKICDLRQKEKLLPEPTGNSIGVRG
jgi:hypothetical protein